MRKLAFSSILVLLFVAGNNCSGITDAADHILFGISIRDGVESSAAAVSCSSDVSVTTTSVSLVEDGDQDRTYNTGTQVYSDSPTSGFGYRSVEVCVYLTKPFNGTVEIPVSNNGTYTGRINVATSKPVAANPMLSGLNVSPPWPGSGQTMPTTLTFVGNGTVGHGAAAAQCFTMTRVNTGLDPKENPYKINLGEITSDSSGVYKGQDVCDVSATVEDDDGPGARVSSISRIMEEPGGTGFTTASFTVVLRQAPTANVTIPVSATYDATNAGNREGTSDKSSLTFTTANWNIAQTVTITSQDDLEVDGTKTYVIGLMPASSSDANYNNLDPRDVVVINNDKSVPGYTYTLFDATGGNTTASTGATVNGFATDEMNNLGTTYSNFSIKLRSRPSADVTLNFSTSNSAISTVQTPSITFTPNNWNVNQTVSVVGKSNGTDGANVDYTISFTTTSTDNTYANGSAIPRPTFVMRSCDNDGTHLIQPCNFSGSPLGTSGNRLSGAEPSATTYMWLITKSAPGSAVSVGLTSSDTTEGTVPASVTIDSSNYASLGATANRIALSHVDDTALDGSVNWTVTTGTSTGGLTYDPLDVFATTTDNEQRYYILVTGTTKEDDTKTATIDICLGATNANSVQIDAACSGSECGSVSPANVTFTPGETITAGTPTNALCGTDANRKTFTVHGADDSLADGTKTFSVTFTVTTTDPVYSGNNPSSQSVSNEDDEAPGKAIFIKPTAVVGEMTAAGVGGADNYCTTDKPAYAPSGTYKAMIGSAGSVPDGISARSTSTSWVLTAGNIYYRCDSSSCADSGSTRLFIANGSALFNPLAMSADFSTNTGDQFWTGFNNDLSLATQTSTPGNPGADPAYRDNCAGWTYKTGPTSPFNTYYATTWNSTGGNAINVNTNVDCNLTKKIICVQQ
ncbi:MAG: hypothetical protein JNM27_22730 [Leptospirales bacterium]|nr:hypothetical protein [Leptospirales bacterium]